MTRGEFMKQHAEVTSGFFVQFFPNRMQSGHNVIKLAMLYVALNEGKEVGQ